MDHLCELRWQRRQTQNGHPSERNGEAILVLYPLPRSSKESKGKYLTLPSLTGINILAHRLSLTVPGMSSGAFLAQAGAVSDLAVPTHKAGSELSCEQVAQPRESRGSLPSGPIMLPARQHILCLRVYAYTCAHVSAHIYTRVYMCTCVHVYMCTCVCVCVYERVSECVSE